MDNRDILNRYLRASQAITSTTELKSIYRTVTAISKELLALDFSTLMLLSEDKKQLVIEDTIGFPEDTIGTFSLVQGEGLSTWVVLNREAGIVKDFASEERFAVPPIVAEYKITSALCIPMVLENDIFGVLVGHTIGERDFTRDDILLYRSIGNHAATAIKNSLHLSALAQSRELYRTLYNDTPTLLHSIDRTGKVVEVNDHWLKTMGYERHEVIGRDVTDFYTPESRKYALEVIQPAFFQEGFCSNIAYRFVKKNGEIVDVLLSATGERDTEGRIVRSRAVIEDITERKRVEEQLRHMQKLEAVGTLAGGIAHDFNNLLQGIFGYLSMARISIGDHEKTLAMLEQAEKALHLAVNLTSQLLTFSKGGKPVKKVIQLRQVIDNAAKFALSGSKSSYRIDIEDTLWPVLADEGQLSQVIHNIALNADQAMPLGGTVHITAKNIDSSKERVPSLLEHGKYAAILIRDTGIGIPEEYLSKIFDPYFTSKEKGSGLGLATSYSIIKNHGGLIDVSSQPGKGTEFAVYIPATEPAVKDVERPEVSASMRPCKVLLMDDEEIIRDVAGEMISALGHEVALAGHGEAALAEYKRANDVHKPFDVVILDLTIRCGMGGVDTLKQLRETDPGVKAVVSSGYSDNSVLSEYRRLGFVAVLNKPYTIEGLRDVLAGVIK